MEINTLTLTKWLDKYKLHSGKRATHLYCGEKIYGEIGRHMVDSLIFIRSTNNVPSEEHYSEIEQCLTISQPKSFSFMGCSIIRRDNMEDGLIMIFDRAI